MNKRSILILISAITLMLVMWVVVTYNSFVNKQETVDGKWANVENKYQRRSDLIPNLVAIVKGYAAHENETFQQVTNARAKASQTTLNAQSMTSQDIDKYRASQAELSSAIGRLILVTENYPQLKANQNFLELQAQLEGTENRIAVERGRYNEAVREYNASIRQFPNLLIASLLGFVEKPYFEAEKGSETVTDVRF